MEQRRGMEQRSAGLVAELAHARSELESARHALRRVDGSVSWQLFQRARVRAFALAGGERSGPVRLLQANLRALGRATRAGAQASE
jgi:hypothetical protein